MRWLVIFHYDSFTFYCSKGTQKNKKKEREIDKFRDKTNNQNSNQLGGSESRQSESSTKKGYRVSIKEIFRFRI